VPVPAPATLQEGSVSKSFLGMHAAILCNEGMFALAIRKKEVNTPIK